MFSIFLILKLISGRCPVPDLRFDWLCDLWQSPSRIPAYLHITDIAGLIRGASGSNLQVANQRVQNIQDC